ncbi:MAG: ABC transporter ATP-binding protein [Candidatus Hodarchaeales archaeon]|jgi:ABC-2 type transport system ATP-binding protein
MRVKDAIVVHNLSKVYEQRPSWISKLLKRNKSIRHVDALRSLSFTIEAGSFVGLLGPNGAGKTTLIKILTTLLLPTSGTFSVNGFEPHQSNEIKASIGAMLMGERGLYWKLTGRENLEYFANLYHVPSKESKERIESILDLINLRQFVDRPVETYSSGQKMKFAFAKSLISDPPILILDEPTIAMDVQGARELRKIVKELHQLGKTILYSSHIMSEIEELAEKVIIIDHGEMIDYDTPDALKADLKKDEKISIEGFFPALETLLFEIQAQDGVLRAASSVVENSGSQREQLEIIVDNSRLRMPRLLERISNIPENKITFIDPQEVTLEDVFIAKTGRSLSEDTRVM